MLSRRALEILRLMAESPEGKGELACEGIQCYLGTVRVHSSTVKQLVRCMAIRRLMPDEGLAYYVISNTGRSILRRPELASEVIAAMLAGRRFNIRDDRIEDLPD
jgi:hypothetical protein